MAIEFIAKDPHVPRPQVLEMPTDARQPLDPLRIGILGDEFGPFPALTQLVEPAPHGLR